jgi:hypothetical protein
VPSAVSAAAVAVPKRTFFMAVFPLMESLGHNSASLKKFLQAATAPSEIYSAGCNFLI